ncbi:MAG: dihydropteroate synthase [Cytophagales bacterium]|nr:dihydropteroate synthase [Cytophagales bacterium]MDW8384281.1 dihydropteroate synthase [Flammeovirgaceae bacterium]
MRFNHSSEFLQVNRQLFSLREGIVMGILNVTPDSFYAPSRVTVQIIADRAGQMLQEGAHILDVGGYSTRPNASDVPLSEELERVLVAVETIVKYFPNACISVDTFRSHVAEKAIQAGAHIINDVSGGQADPQMFACVGRLKVPYVLMHSRGNPQTMQSLTNYTHLIEEIMVFFQNRIHKLIQHGCCDIIIDVGFGFAKTLEQNYLVLNQLEKFKIFELPILVGISRKSMIWKLLKSSPDDALNGTSALHLWALSRGANILRVHDVKPAIEILQIYRALQTY